MTIVSILALSVAFSPPPAPGVTTDFVGAPRAGIFPHNVTFTDTSTGSPTSWVWDFGDGTTSTAQNPAHLFTAPGAYTVSLTASNESGSETITKVDYITVADSLPIADFSATPTTGPDPLSVDFTDMSIGQITSYAWSFGDGATSTASDPSHLYTTPATYSVSLTVTGGGSSDVRTRSDFITVTGVPTADFQATPTSGPAPLNVVFSDLSLGQITSYAWDFGDGNTSSLPSPGHTYAAAGTYSVSLMVTGPGGSDTNTMTDLVTVAGQGLHAFLEGSQMVPPVTSNGTGSATLALDAGSMSVSVTGSYADLNADQFNITVRKGFYGTSGGAVYSLTGTGGTTGTFSGGATLTQPQWDDMLAGLHYVQIHTASHPFGEIRGQICQTANVAFRNAGTNPASYSGIAPVIGGTFNASVDLTTTGHNFAILVGFQTPLTLTLGNGTTLLVNIADVGGELFSFPAQPGPIASFTSPVPDNLSVCSFLVFSQAVHIGGVTPFALSNAQDLIIGY